MVSFWDAQSVPPRVGPDGPHYWLDSEQVLRDYVYPHFGGLSWFQYLRERYAQVPRRKAFSLCCGRGEVERALYGAEVCAHLEGLDISPEAIEVCRREAAGLNGTFSYRMADLEHLTLPEQEYDLVLGWMALHHLKNLSPLFAQVHRTLQPEGIFVVNEYVGPARFKMTKAAVKLVNEWWNLIPRELRTFPSGRIPDIFISPDPAEVAARDPSEAITSHRILPLLERHFTILDRIDYGGAVVHWAVADILQNFDPQSPEHQAYLEQLYNLEREALRRGVIESDFTFVVAGRR